MFYRSYEFLYGIIVVTAMTILYLAKEPSLQAFNTSTENGILKGSRNAGATSSLVAGGKCLVPKNGQEPLKQQFNLSEGGKLLSQERDSEGGVTAKKPVVLSDSEDGPSQAVAINGKGAKFTTTQVSHK